MILQKIHVYAIPAVLVAEQKSVKDVLFQEALNLHLRLEKGPDQSVVFYNNLVV